MNWNKELVKEYIFSNDILTALEVIVNGDPISVEPDRINDLAQLTIDYFNK